MRKGFWFTKNQQELMIKMQAVMGNCIQADVLRESMKFLADKLEIKYRPIEAEDKSKKY